METSCFKVDPARLEQAYNAIRSNLPSEEDLLISQRLEKYMKIHFPTETDENIQRRSIILTELRQIFRTWVYSVCLQRGLSQEMAKDAGGQIYVSGSYRLGVNEPGADIDTICVAPKHVTRDDFFTSLKEIFLKHPKVTNLVSIEGAVVPIITFDYEEINIDLQIAILPRNTIPEDLNILDDKILIGTDPPTEKSLNGPRVTELMIKLTPNRDSFISVLRIVRRWAKRRGLYSNKMGYLGGINWCILVCFINQLYPTASPSTLLLRFFMVLVNWKWPLAIQLCKTYDAKLGLDIWNATIGSNRYHTMPILTPAYPSMNSSYNVSVHTLSVMREEFKRALDVVQEIINAGGEIWDKLFKNSDFFAVHQHYLAVDVYAANEEDKQAWCGYCESRLRKLVDSLAYIRPLCRIRAYPKKFELAHVTEKKDQVMGVCYYIAFDIDKKQLRNSKELHIDTSVNYFKQNDLRWPKRKSGMEVKITPVQWKKLPDAVFDDMGGKFAAKDIRLEFLRRKKNEGNTSNPPTSSVVPDTKTHIPEEEAPEDINESIKRNSEDILGENNLTDSTSHIDKKIKICRTFSNGSTNALQPQELSIHAELKPSSPQDIPTTLDNDPSKTIEIITSISKSEPVAEVVKITNSHLISPTKPRMKISFKKK